MLQNVLTTKLGCYYYQTQVISTYYSLADSIKLPMYHITIEEYGIKIILISNFHDWAISVKSNKPLNFDQMILSIFNQKRYISSDFIKEILEDKLYGIYSQNHLQFTCEIDSDYNLYTFIFLLSYYL